MDWHRLVDAFRARLGAMIRPQRADAELHDELSFHMAMQTQANMKNGMTPDEAARTAHRALGNPTRIREDVHDLSALPFVETLWQDVRYGLRILRTHPTFTLVAILTLALGTGANAAIFQLVNALRLRPLPVEKPEQLVSLRFDQHGKGRVGRGYLGGYFSEPLWQEIRSQQQAFSSMLAWGIDRWDLSSDGEVVYARGLYVSGHFFDALGVRPHAGRVFTEADDRKGCGSPGAVLSYGFWQTRYGGNPSVIGQIITLDRHPFEVVGIAPPSFFGVEVGRTFDVALPLCAEPIIREFQPATGRRDAWWLDIMGRLKPDWTVDRAQSQIAAMSPSVFQATVPSSYKSEWAKNYTAFTLTAQPAATGVSNLRTAYATQLWALLGATALVLLLTCANLANLMLARASARAREIAVRLAIGASRRRIVRQMLSESALVAAFGALGGWLLARWLSQMLVVFLNAGSNRIFVDLTPDWRVFAFVTLIAVLTCGLFGLSPALNATRRDLAAAMQPGGRSSTDGHEAVRLRRGLVVAQVALSIVLVVGALLFGRTLMNLGGVELGFNPDVVVASVDLRRTSVPPAARPQAFADIVSRLEQVPGVSRAAETLIVPLSGPDWNGAIVKGGVAQNGDAHFNEVGGGYFAVMQIPLVAGRVFDSQDRPDSPKAAIANEAFARRYFPNVDPIGQTFQTDAPPPQPVYHIVGVVRNAKLLQVREERTLAAVRFSAGESSGPFLPIAYLALSQDMTPPPDFRIVVRTGRLSASLTRALTHAVTQAVPGTAVSYDAVATYIDRLLVTERLMAWLSGFFGVLALMIAAIGLYGVMSYLVTRRRVEIGVRMALGAGTRQVIQMVLGESATLLAIGIAIGGSLAMFGSRYAASLLYGLTPFDPASFALGTAALAFVSLLACYLPARRATQIDPITALRDE